MTDEAVAQATEAAPAAFKTTAIPSAFVQEPSASPEPPAATTPEVVETPDAQAAPDELDDDEASPATPERAPLPKGVQRKINKLTRRLGESSETISELQERLSRYESGQVLQKPTEAKPAESTKDDGKPKLIDFDFDPDAHAEALVEWKLAQREQKAAAETRVKTLQEKEAAFSAAHPDYMEVTRSPDVPFTRQVIELMSEADDPPAVAYYLGNHVDEARDIAQMSPIAAARAIGRIEAKLAAPAPAPTRELPKKTTNAPPPPKTVSGAGKPEVTVDDPNITAAQRIALWQANRRKS